MKYPPLPYNWLSDDGASSIVSTSRGYIFRHLEEHGFCTYLGDAKDTIDHLRASWLDAQRDAA